MSQLSIHTVYKFKLNFTLKWTPAMTSKAANRPLSVCVLLFVTYKIHVTKSCSKALLNAVCSHL